MACTPGTRRDVVKAGQPVGIVRPRGAGVAAWLPDSRPGPRRLPGRFAVLAFVRDVRAP